MTATKGLMAPNSIGAGYNSEHRGWCQRDAELRRSLSGKIRIHAKRPFGAAFVFHNPLGTMDNLFPGDLQVSGELLYLYFVKALIVNVITANPTNANTLSNSGGGV